MTYELNPRLEKLIYIIAGIVLLFVIIDYFYDSNKDSQQKMSYTEYEDCGLDTAKWRMVYNNLIEEACNDFSDGIWNNEPLGGWNSKNAVINYYVRDNIANQDVSEQIEMIRHESYERIRKVHKMNPRQEESIMNKLGMEWR